MSHLFNAIICALSLLSLIIWRKETLKWNLVSNPKSSKVKERYKNTNYFFRYRTVRTSLWCLNIWQMRIYIETNCELSCSLVHTARSTAYNTFESMQRMFSVFAHQQFGCCRLVLYNYFPLRSTSFGLFKYLLSFRLITKGMGTDNNSTSLSSK